MEIKLIYSTEGLGHQRRCEILKQKFEYLGFETSIEPYASKNKWDYKHEVIYLFDSKNLEMEIGYNNPIRKKSALVNCGVYNIGLIDFKPSKLNNNKPSIDYCVLHPEILNFNKTIEDRKWPHVLQYGCDISNFESDALLHSLDDRERTHLESIKLIKNMDMAIVKAGLIAYETIACGIPTYVFGTDYYEWHRALELQNRGLAKIWNPEKETELPKLPTDLRQNRLKDGSDMIIKNLLGELL